MLTFYFQKQALEQTKAVFPGLNEKIRDALSKLEEQLVSTTLSSIGHVDPHNSTNTHSRSKTRNLLHPKKSPKPRTHLSLVRLLRRSHPLELHVHLP